MRDSNRCYAIGHVRETQEYCRSDYFYKYACLCLTDFDECDLEYDNCHEDALCVNTPTHFECHCKNGFLGDGINCTGQENLFRVNDSLTVNNINTM